MNIDAAKSMIKEAGDCLEEAQRTYTRSSYNLAVRRSQDAGNLKRIAEISKRLARDREPSFYMERIYLEAMAKEAVESAQFVYEYIEKLLRYADDKANNNVHRWREFIERHAKDAKNLDV